MRGNGCVFHGLLSRRVYTWPALQKLSLIVRTSQFEFQFAIRDPGFDEGFIPQDVLVLYCITLSYSTANRFSTDILYQFWGKILGCHISQ